MNIPTPYNALFLIAPAGWGKTSLILELYQRNNWNILYISPLKTLEQEVQTRAMKIQKETCFFTSLTAERVPSFLDKLKISDRENLMVVFDEIHLWNAWGNSFRHQLWECFFQVINQGIPFLALTATLRSDYEKEWEKLLEHGSYHYRTYDLGNGKIFNEPKRVISYFGFSKKFFVRRILHECEKRETCLIFCQYRKEVMRLAEILRENGFDAKTCVGGESMEFVSLCNSKGIPRIIISTSVLSHGVNLGEVKKVFISYEIFEWDMYLQMLARGGRLGGGFEVFSFQKEGSNYWNKLKLWFFDRYLQLFYA